MAEFPTVARMPGGYSDLDADDFEPGVVKGLRTAGLVLLVFAGLEVAVWAFGARPSFTVIVDVFLGVQLLRLRHSWKLWALVRSWVGLALAGLAMLASFADGLSTTIGLGAGAQVAYSGSVILLLTGVPSPRALLIGRICFVLAVVLYLGLVLWGLAYKATALTAG
jgi:hypothetical protein